MKDFLTPDYMFGHYYEITPEFLKSIGVRALLIDIDNTLAPYEQPDPDERIRNWFASLAENGINVETFKSKKITPALLRDAVAIVCMTEKHRDYLMDMRWSVLRKLGVEDIENNVYSFAELTGSDVLDPYGKDIECYRYVYALLATGMPMLIEKLHLREHAILPKKRGRRKKIENNDETNSTEMKE